MSSGGGRRLAEYEIGAQFIDNADTNTVATVIDKRSIGEVIHYKLSVEPNLYNAQPRWLSEYGILIDYAPMMRGRKSGRREGATHRFLGFLRSHGV